MEDSIQTRILNECLCIIEFIKRIGGVGGGKLNIRLSMYFIAYS